MCVDGGGDADVGVPEEFLDDDEFDALFQEEGRGRVAEVVDADLSEVRSAEERVEVAGSIGWPSGRVKTWPLSTQPAPAFSFSWACCLR